ncbi:hypothetical protein WMY93_030408 [Mugilogobius chulae]|uniref:Uncharacterized protein n=1 Tax=Mugilogobius chulae TaxID=88201 RepID=A0AAW0MEF3_9GOBI
MLCTFLLQTHRKATGTSPRFKSDLHHVFNQCDALFAEFTKKTYFKNTPEPCLQTETGARAGGGAGTQTDQPVCGSTTWAETLGTASDKTLAAWHRTAPPGLLTTLCPLLLARPAWLGPSQSCSK